MHPRQQNRSKKWWLMIGIPLIALFGAGMMLMQGETVEKGPVTVTDHRELPGRDARLTKVVDGLDAPWGFTWLPTGEILITERFGTLQLYQPNDKQLRPVSGVPQVFSAGQGGLLDITLHPDFATNRTLYLSYAHGTEEGNRLRVARARLNGTALDELDVIFEVAQTKSGPQHFGSRFQWLPDGTLLISVGDGGNPPTEYNGKLIREQAQSLAAHLGKLVRIHDDGSIPDDNPFSGRPDARAEIWSYGHRNVQGITYDSTRKRVIASEHGSKGGDELNAVFPGKNYGWPLATYSTEYDVTGTPITPHQALPETEDPLAVWTPSIAPSGIVYYSGERYGDWKGNLFLAAMLLRSDKTILAYRSRPAGAVLRLVTDAQGQIASQERISVGEYRVRDIDQGPDDHLYVLTDSTERQNAAGVNAGALWKIEPSD